MESLGTITIARHSLTVGRASLSHRGRGMIDPAVLVRGKQALLMSAILPKIDYLIEESARVKAPAPGLLELREWVCFNLEENAEIAAASLGERS